MIVTQFNIYSFFLDYVDSRLFWIDAKLHTIKSSQLDGSNIRTVVHNAKHIAHPFAVAVFEDDVYWTDWSSDSIRKANKHTGEDFQQVALGLRSPMDLKIYHSSIQKSGKTFISFNTEKDSQFWNLINS